MKNNCVLGEFAKRNIIIDKPLLARKREVGQMRNDNFDLYGRAPLQDDATSTKSPVNRQLTESDDNTRTPDVQFRPVQPDNQFGYSKRSEKERSRLNEDDYRNVLNNELHNIPKHLTESEHESQLVVAIANKDQMALAPYQGEQPSFSSESLNERESGFPRPEKYDSYYVNQYSIPKSLHCGKREDRKERKRELEK